MAVDADKGQVQQCVVYKGRKRADSYLYVERRDDFSRVPEALLKMLGGVQFVMDLELWPGRPLAQVDSRELISQLRVRGFLLQMPRRPEDALM
jgi:uncharacterized protein YcgL (UPF0745 family)